MKIVIVSKDNPWSTRLVKNLSNENFETVWLKQVDSKTLRDYKPDWVFFFHWSNIVKEEIYKNHKCVVIHTGVLPHHRGGSPLQNQIINGVKTTEVNLLTMEKEVDSGSIYCKQAVSLQGSMTDIWMVIAEVSTKLIIRCVKDNLTPIKQNEKEQISTFRRRMKQPIDFASSVNVEQVYDQIRMMDAESYPKSYIEVGNYILEFTRATLKGEAVIADVKISKK